MIMSSLQIIIILVNPLDARHQTAPVDLSLQTLGQEEHLIAPIPCWEMDGHQHNPRIVRFIGHSSMPQSEVPDDQRTLG